jgi:2-hydroxy-3-oxopropionate reductase
MNITVGFIGLGVMGTPMARNLINNGYRLSIYSRRAESMAPLIDAGARGCTSPKEVARAADCTIIMVSDSKDLEEVILGSEGVLAGVRPGATVVEMSTVSPEVVRGLAVPLRSAGVELLDAPVSGGEREAEEAALTIMAGGSAAAFALIRPLFACLGKNIVHVGTGGAGQLAKACNQILVSLALEGVAEAFTFAGKNGVDPFRVREALLGGFAGSRVLEVQGKRMLDRDFRPGFAVRLHQEDLRIITEEAYRMGLALPGVALVAQHMNALMGSKEGERDLSILVNVIERMNAGRKNAPVEVVPNRGARASGEKEPGVAAPPDSEKETEATPTVGFIGLGVMGKPMALNLIKGGYRLRVYGRRRETLASLVEAGATACGSAEEAARGADIIFTMVTTTHDVLDVVLGEKGVIAGARRGAIVANMATISPAATRLIAARLLEAGIESLDAPVSGGGIGAVNRTLSIMVGGNENVVGRVKPLFACMGKSIVHIGSHSAGQVAKACNQVVMLMTLQGLAEAFTFARRSGLAPERVYESLSGGAAECRILEVLGKRMVERNYVPGIEARLHAKDIQIVLNEAYTLGMALPGTALVTQMFNALIGRGGGTQDSSQLVEVIEAISATEHC